jgi:GNAT superfamily N-acetyltransferase
LPNSSKVNSHFERDTAGEAIYVSVAEDGNIAGFVSVWMPQSFIHHLYVHPDARGQGVATTLLDFLHGRVPLPWRLKCGQQNTRAASFYLHRGWNLIDQVQSGEEPFFLLEFTGE